MRPLPVGADGLPESSDGDGGVKRGVVSDCGAREGEVGEGRIVEASGLGVGVNPEEADGADTGEGDGPRDTGPGAGSGEPEALH